jgi:MGT family glycosyltransferase
MYALFATVPLVGHINPLLRQAEELQRRGRRVAVASLREMRDHVASESPNLPFVDLGVLGPIADELRRNEQAASLDPNFARGAYRITKGLWPLWPAMFDGLVSAIAADRPDVMVVDLFTPAGFSAAEATRVPFVVNNADLLSSISVKLLPPADHVPFLFSRRSIRDVGIGQRVAGPLLRRFATALTSLTMGRELNRLRRSRGLPAIDLHDMLRDRLILVNAAFGLEYQRPLPPSIELVGPMLPATIPELPLEMDGWLSEGPPVVYANLGTLAVAPDRQLATMVDAFGSDAFRVLWILKAPQAARLPARLPGNLRILDWGPAPLAILAHSKVKVFVSHCGINSVHESLHAGTPIVGIPMFADQRDMAVRIADAGVGLWLDKRRFSAGDLRAAVVRVLDDGEFQHNISAIQQAFARAGGVRRAADLIEQHGQRTPSHAPAPGPSLA